MDELERQVWKQAEFLPEFQKSSLPVSVKERAAVVILDSAGCILNGLRQEKIGRMCEDAIPDLSAAMIGTELYEGNRKAVGHPACHILPLLFAEAGERSLEEFTELFVRAYEIAGRLGSAVRFPTDILGHGTVMSTGAVAAECMLEGLGTQDTYEALLAGVSLPNVSVWQSVFDGSGLHDAYAGFSALTSRQAVRMARRGLKSTGAIVTAVYGDTLHANIHPEKLSEKLSEEYLLESNYFKVHTGCRFVHPFADVLSEELRNGLKKEDVSQIRVYTYKKAAKLTAQRVPNDLAAKFSTPVSLAVLLEKGELTPDSIRGCQDDPDIAAWEGRIRLYEDEKYNRLLPDIRAGLVEIVRKDGSVLVREASHAVGDFDHPEPFGREAVADKFRKVTSRCLSLAEQDEIIRQIFDPDMQKKPAETALAVFYTNVFERTK